MRAKEEKNNVKITFTNADDDESSVNGSDDADTGHGSDPDNQNTLNSDSPRVISVIGGKGRDNSHVNMGAVFDLRRE
jgi:hypothetical protein